MWFKMHPWVIPVILGVIGLFYFIVQVPIFFKNTKKDGRNHSGIPFVGGLHIFIAGIISPCKWLAIFCLLDYAVIGSIYKFINPTRENNNLYVIDYCGLENIYENAKSFYKAGELVVLRYSLIATDTDYSFTLDGESVDYSYKNGAFEISFNMPDHNVKLELHSVNTMAMKEQNIATKADWKTNEMPEANAVLEEQESTVCIYQGDITEIECDCIVNAANKTLLGGGGVDGAIHRAAGPELLKECRTLNGCETGEAKLTRGYNLPAKYIIHTVGPIYSGCDMDKKLLAACYTNSLNLAKANGIQSIAFPAISTGAYGYPLLEATKIAVKATFEWLEANKDCEMRIIFCCFDSDIKKMYEEIVY